MFDNCWWFQFSASRTYNLIHSIECDGCWHFLHPLSQAKAHQVSRWTFCAKIRRTCLQCHTSSFSLPSAIEKCIQSGGSFFMFLHDSKTIYGYNGAEISVWNIIQWMHEYDWYIALICFENATPQTLFFGASKFLLVFFWLILNLKQWIWNHIGDTPELSV